MNQSINTDSKNSKEPHQKYRLGTVSIKILGGLNRFYGRPTSPSASIMAQNIQLFGPRGGLETLSTVEFVDSSTSCMITFYIVFGSSSFTDFHSLKGFLKTDREKCQWKQISIRIANSI